MNETVKEALQRLEKGKFVMVYDRDEREEEIDLVTPSKTITPENIRRLRKDAGGLICVTVPPSSWEKLELPYLSELYRSASNDFPILSEMKADDIPYDEKSTFSLSVNHRETFTGITDEDRALTIRKFAELGEDINQQPGDQAQKMFGDNFRTPGHVFLLNATKGLLHNREGHTELTTALLQLTDLYPSMTICEMMADDGDSLSVEEGKEYGEKHDIPLVKGDDIIDAWKKERPKVDVEVDEKEDIRVMAVGTFDIVHLGHLHYLEEARALGDELVVVVACDETVREHKHEPLNDEKTRREMMEALKPVDRAVVGDEEDRYKTVEELDPDIIALGYDQRHEEEKLKQDLKERGLDSIKVKRMSHHHYELDGTRGIIRKIIDWYSMKKELEKVEEGIE
ncbi:MAG: 3,4-dihydroxy-2-butanone-4-phosphate synthase [Candidatus Natronoplasma sp.]